MNRAAVRKYWNNGTYDTSLHCMSTRYILPRDGRTRSALRRPGSTTTANGVCPTPTGDSCPAEDRARAIRNLNRRTHSSRGPGAAALTGPALEGRSPKSSCGAIIASRAPGEAAASGSARCRAIAAPCSFDPAHRLASSDLTGTCRVHPFLDALRCCDLAGLARALNGRLPSPLPMNRFRPNLVLDGLEPTAKTRPRVSRRPPLART